MFIEYNNNPITHCLKIIWAVILWLLVVSTIVLWLMFLVSLDPEFGWKGNINHNLVKTKNDSVFVNWVEYTKKEERGSILNNPNVWAIWAALCK
jgi:hypothetical protein